MENLFHNAMLLVLSEKCYETFFVDFNFLHAPCLTAALSKSLGLAIILGSTLVKVPQIVKIANAKSAKGINMAGVLLEVAALSSALAYNYTNSYPFSSWGEQIFLLVETAIIGFLIFLFDDQLGLAMFFVTFLSGSLYVLCCGLTPSNVLWAMQAANLPIVVFAKLLQAWANFRQGHTGQLSFVTMLLLLAGCCARIFTSIQETNDPILVLTAALAAAANGVLFIQIIYYKDATAKALKPEQKGLDAKKKAH